MLWFLLACGQPALDVDLDHRRRSADCPADHPDPAPSECHLGADDACATNSDCSDGANGRCTPNEFGTACGCSYDQCVRDEDCGGTSICVCAGADGQGQRLNNSCQESGCRTDADCASGLCLGDRQGCGSVDDAASLFPAGFQCATDADTCRSDSACTGAAEFCVYSGAWACSTDYAITCE